MQTEGFIQPQSYEAETSVLGAILEDSTLIEKVVDNLYEDKIFYHERHKLLWRRILEMRRNREDIDMVTVLANLSTKDKKAIGGAGYISELIDMNIASSQIERHAEIILKKYLQRRVIENSEKIMKVAYEDTTDLDDLIEQSHRFTSEIDLLRPGKGFDLNYELQETVEDILDTQSLLAYGYSKLDSLAGGMTRGEITVVGGRPGHGKTTFVLNLLYNLLQK